MQNMIDWEKEWKKKTRIDKKLRSRIKEPDYWNKRAEDYVDYIKTSDYDHGRKIVKIFEEEGILKHNFEVLDICAGPGSVSIPFAEVVKKVTAIEPAKEMVKHLVKSAEEKKLQNIEIIEKSWEEVNTTEFKAKFDITVCSHGIWLFENIGEFIAKMNEVSRGYCCIADCARDYKDLDEIYKKLGIELPKFERFIYLYTILYQKDILANVKIIDTFMKRSVQSATNMYKFFLSRYREPTKEDIEIIKNHVLINSKNGIYTIKSKMAVVWWENR